MLIAGQVSIGGSGVSARAVLLAISVSPLIDLNAVSVVLYEPIKTCAPFLASHFPLAINCFAVMSLAFQKMATDKTKSDLNNSHISST